MFNRGNFSVPNPFGSGSPGGGDGSQRPTRDRYNAPSGYGSGYGQDSRIGGGYASPNRRLDSDTVMTDSFNGQNSYGDPTFGRGAERPLPPRHGGGRMGPGGSIDSQIWTLRPAKSPDNSYIFGNL